MRATCFRCDEDIDECSSNVSPCQNGGTCVNLPSSYRCECPEEFTGDSCEDIRLITCEDRRCKNGSTCTDVFNPKTDDNFTCTCMPGYEGRFCDTAYCTGNKCQNGGRCDLYQVIHLLNIEFDSLNQTSKFTIRYLLEFSDHSICFSFSNRPLVVHAQLVIPASTVRQI